MSYNILLVVIDCLRYDRVTDRYMPFLTNFGRENTTFTNFWSVSHCTDPVMTALLTGKWPDELRLYSMMFEHKDYSIPADVEMLAQTAKKHGYTTGMVSNLARWYMRGVDRYVDNRNWQGANTFAHATQMIKQLPQPWFLTVHDDSCHTNYRGGSYDTACTEVDTDLCHLLSSVTQDDNLYDNTFIFVTADHGEGLGEHGIIQHGFGLWPFLTHVPLIIKWPGIVEYRNDEVHYIGGLFQHIELHQTMRNYIVGVGFDPKSAVPSRDYAHMVGYTPIGWHRGVTDGRTLVIKGQPPDKQNTKFTEVDLEIGNEITYHMAGDNHELWNEARKHAARFGIDADDDSLDDEILEQRLRSLGYFE